MVIDLIKEGKIADAIELLQKNAVGDVEKYTKEFNNDRTIRATQVGKRSDKVTAKEVIKVAKIPIPFQRKIVKSAASFLFAKPVKLIGKEVNDNNSIITDLWDDLRMDSLLLNFCKTVKSETSAAIVFFPVKKEGEIETKIKARILDNTSGKLYPEFDAFGDMISFGWEYETTENDKKVKYLYLYTAETNYIFRNEKEWLLASENGETKNELQKIPIVYLSQEHPEWWEVQDLIDRFENTFARFCDTNDYFANPKYKIKGSVGTYPDKDTTAIKVDIVETENGNVVSGDVDIISWDRAPEALKLEFETSEKLIYGLSDTANFSTESMKGIGNVANYAMELMFYGSILKAKWDEGDYQVVISRIINIMKASVKVFGYNGKKIDLEENDFNVQFQSVLPKNLKEIMEILSEATGGKATMSQATAVANNPLVEDNEEELETIQEEETNAKKVELGSTVI
ncbi:phage portal protein [Lutibacter maritimus]|uniref:Phage portal protein, SPP1 family n=1 Tax=Lutibacter maritimus TaxID=593133 RepID=A0A1I6NRZ0_9FLAO|nr:phage portal protein [Lutibacter maritimus]SFS30707.1 phage portal protein, SPP1 family [Lutibacter maritimus]